MPELRESAPSLTAAIVVVDDWRVLRRARLLALRTSPGAFLARYETEARHPNEWWRREVSRGDWLVAIADGCPVGLLGVTADAGPDEGFLSYLWVHPRRRRSGVASMLMSTALDRLQERGISRVWLWVLDDNTPAWNLYQRFGFDRTRHRQQLPDDPSRWEERLALHII
jgi:ribosomal protein S18 acetylase RimI-like enzyme